MKFHVSWTPRLGGSGRENEETLQRAYEIFGRWKPTATVHQFLGRVDGRGGFAIVETDDAEAIARDIAAFVPFLDYEVHPVLDIDRSTAVDQEAIQFRGSP